MKRREAWADEFFRGRPDARISGDDSCISEMRKIYGVALSSTTLTEIKNRVRKELGKSEPQAEKKVEPMKTSSKPDIATAAQLVLEAIPHLRTFSIVVGDDGKPKVSYTIRETRIVEESHEVEVTR